MKIFYKLSPQNTVLNKYLYYVTNGNKGLGKLQGFINEETEEIEHRAENFYIIKLMAFGNIKKEGNNGDIKLEAYNTVDSIEYIFKSTHKKPFSIVEKAEGGDLSYFLHQEVG